MSKHHAQHTSDAHTSTASNEQTGTDYAAAYRASRERAAYAKTALGAFEASLDFPLDDFQRQACAAVEADRSVLVAAPTGAGKTIVGEFGIYLALRRGMKAFYTTPIKALSNQKYHDFVRAYGEDYVGLLTGDTSINTEAPVVVMTTEVLRNMLYANSTTLTGLGYVVMDEVHYLADRFRGAVWEEAIIHLPEHVNVISLSATVSNVEEFGAWLDTVRGGTDIIVSEHRPVPLWQHMMVGHRVVDLFVPEDNSAQGKNHTQGKNQEPEEKLSRKQAKKAQKAKQRGATVEAGANPLLAGLRLNPQLKALRPGFRSSPGRGRYGGKRERFRHRREGWLNETFSSGERGGSNRRDRFSNDRFSNDREFDARGEQKPLRPQRITRPEMVRALDKQGLLPAICFIFSRAGCDGAVSHCVSADITLTTPEQQQTIRAYIAEATAHLDTRDLNTLGYYEWRDGLIRGIAAHHAGLLPLFKEVVETLFAQGLIKLVFATETLALGINMPARTVILEKLTKYNGESHVDITAGEYTQLTGRAGRRGIDIEGHAVVMWRPGMSPEHVATLASTRTYPLNSSFRPTYNMAANLIASYGAERTRKILESSFAQFQADKSVVGIASRVRKNENALEGYREAMACHLGDFTEYVQLSRQIAELEKKASKSNERHARAQAHHSIQQLLPGDIIYIPHGRSRGYAVVITRSDSHADPRIGIVTEDAHQRTASTRDFEGAVEPVSRIKIPKRLSLKTPKERRDTASRMRQALYDGRAPRALAQQNIPARQNSIDAQLEALQAQLRNHPCHGCSDRANHMRWAERWQKLNSETEGLRRQIARRTNTIAQVFNRISRLLESYGYVERTEDGELSLTTGGQALRRIYGERDLLTALCLDAHFLDGLEPAAIAATVAALTYQGKRDAVEYLARYPHPSLRAPIATITQRLADLNAAEEQHKVNLTPACDFGLVEPMYAWANGAHLAKAIEDTGLAAGDFVRWAKQVLDALDQIAHIRSLDPVIRARCEEAIEAVRRGVVALDV